MMNKNIKFFDFEKGTDIKILATHGIASGACANEEKENLELSILPENFQSDYAIANEDNFEVILSNLYNKLINRYSNSEFKDQFFIRLGTVLKATQPVKEDVNVNLLPFKSIKNIFLDPRQFNIDIFPVEFESYEKDHGFIINTVAFSRLSNKDVVESIVLIKCLDDYNLTINLKMKKHIWDKKNLQYMNMLDTDMYNFSFSYCVENGITGIFKEPLDILKNTFLNVSKFIDFSKREKNEKTLFENMNNNISISKRRFKFFRSILKYNEEIDGYLQDCKEFLKELKNLDQSNEVFKEEYNTYVKNLEERDKFIGVFLPTENKDFIPSDIPEPDKIIIIPDPYGLTTQPIFDIKKDEKIIDGYVVEKGVKVIKFSSFYIPLPMIYRITMSINIKRKILKLELGFKFPLLSELARDLSDVVLNEFSFKVFIDPSIYFPCQSEKIKNLNKIKYYSNIHKEIKKEIEQFPKDTQYSLNIKNTMHSLTSLLFNSNIFNSLLCDVYYVSDNWKV